MAPALIRAFQTPEFSHPLTWFIHALELFIGGPFLLHRAHSPVSTGTDWLTVVPLPSLACRWHGPCAHLTLRTWTLTIHNIMTSSCQEPDLPTHLRRAFYSTTEKLADVFMNSILTDIYAMYQKKSTNTILSLPDKFPKYVMLKYHIFALLIKSKMLLKF